MNGKTLQTETASTAAPGPGKDGGPVWTLGDLIDLEVLLQEDTEAGDADALRLRDREIFKRHIEPIQPIEPSSSHGRRNALHAWLTVRKAERYKNGVSPGVETLSLFTWMRLSLAVAGAVAAFGAVSSYFRTPPEPTNVLWYGIVCIGLPLALSLYGFWVLLGKDALPSVPSPPAFLRRLLFDVLTPFLRGIARNISEEMGPERRLKSQILVGVFRQRLTSHRSVISMLLFHTAQFFGLGFVCGILAFSWMECALRSCVFGWQTTDKNITAESVHSLVSVAALPWKWIRPEGVGYPSLTQIQNTQFRRFEPFPRQDSQNDPAPAWASFLIWAALVYGVLPRFALERASARRLQKIIREENFEALRFDPLWERLTRSASGFQAPSPDNPARAEFHDLQQSPGDSRQTSFKILVPNHIDTPALRVAITDWTKLEKNWVEPGFIELGPSKADFDNAVESLRPASKPLRVLILQQSFHPPIQQFLSFLQRIRSVSGAETHILVGLIGKPDSHPFGQPTRDLDAKVWNGKLQTLGDPNLGTVLLAANSNPTA